MTTLTGHADIDEQHELLESTVGRLAVFCTKAEAQPGIACGECNSITRKHCRATLTSISSELAAFMAGHSAYEEKMMELLPPTPSCQSHVRAHKAAHEGIARQLKKLMVRAAEDDSPREVSSVIMRVVGDWLGDHSNHFDSCLVSLGRQSSPKMDFDSELVTMLDRHVFPNRPTKAAGGSASTRAMRGKKLEVRGRFETLSPAQREIFWLVVGGRTNREIADQLSVSINTVKTHRAAVFRKMEVATAVELVKKADILR